MVVNNTVNGKKIGKAAGYGDKVSIGYMCTHTTAKKLEVTNSLSQGLPYISKNDIVRETPDFVTIKALPGGNPNKSRREKNDQEITQ